MALKIEIKNVGNNFDEFQLQWQDWQIPKFLISVLWCDRDGFPADFIKTAQNSGVQAIFFCCCNKPFYFAS